MTYTQMLFALSFDKLIFGHSPNWMSILGSSLILGPAIFVAVQKADGTERHVVQSSQREGDEESHRGLMSNTEADVAESDRADRMPVEEVQMRTLR